METPSRHTYNLDGATRVFPVASPIKGDNYCRLEVDSVIVNDRSKYDIVNNAIVFLDAADVPAGSVLDVLVVQSEEAIGQLAITTNIDIVAQNIDNVNAVGVISADVDTVAGISNDVTTVAAIAGTVPDWDRIANDAVSLAIGSKTGADGPLYAFLEEVIATYERGDVDNDGDLDIWDAHSILAYSTNGTTGNTTIDAWIETNIGEAVVDRGLTDGLITYVQDVAAIDANVTAVAGNEANITAVATNKTNIDTVAGDITNVNTVAGIDSDVTTVAGSISDVQTVASNITHVQTVANDLGEVVSEIETVALDLQETQSEINTVAASIANVDTVGNNISNVNTVAGVSTNVTAVAGVSTDVTTVAGISANVTTVAGIDTDVTTVAGNNANVTAVANNNTNVTTVATSIADVNSAADNMAAITAAPTHATNAANSATSASNSATSAANSATAAATSETNAATSATSAATSAASLNIGAIDATILDNAVDVFVYDTSRDSDGGAWRKRTQHTSWYNETLNTATRGSRKEFPAVAVIVAEASKVTIYDADDATMPMWMVFNRGTGSWPSITTVLMASSGSQATATCVAMLNGTLFVGAVDSVNSNPYSTRVNFLEEMFTNSGSAVYTFANTIAERNVTIKAPKQYPMELVNKFVNDVAMTVLPNAPIDSATGLPVPTIAVATDGGASIINNNGTVADIPYTGSYLQVSSINFTESNELQLMTDSSSTQGRMVHVYYSYDSDKITEQGHTATSDEYYATDDWLASADAELSTLEWLYDSTTVGDDLAFGTFKVHRNKLAPAESLFNQTTSTYNTGWVNGDIKLATLSDTDATNVTGSELVTNGTFDTDLTGWTDPNAHWSVVAGEAYHAANGIHYPLIQTVIPDNKTYTLSFDLNVIQGAAKVSLGHIDGVTDLILGSNLLSGSYSFTFSTTAYDSIIFNRHFSGSNNEFYLDNVSLRLAEADRSVNANGLQVHGTITKEAVETNADLVRYRGFSGSTYLSQPYNADLNFTDTMCVNLWLYGANTSRNIFDRGTRYTDHSYGLYIDGAGDVRFYYSTNGTTDNSIEVVGGRTEIAGGWHMVTINVSGGNVGIYFNGVLKKSATLTGNFFSQATTQKPLIVGTGSISGTAWPTNMAMSLFRISGTAMTEEQIKKVYEDEKFLFQDNAQATLYGTSDSVKALAHDDGTNLLHVGTSAGRSVFQGLRRVDNTTTAVGAAISAHNDLVAED